ncbi:MAG: FAD:protein FMN transferase [Candidatus Eisenbacteria bacterium]
MLRSDPAARPLPAGVRDPLSRRRFLARLGLLTGAAVVAPLALRSRGGRPETVQAGRAALGTWMRVAVRDADPARARRAIEAAFAAVRRVDAEMSVHRADSQLSSVNHAAGRGAVRVDESLRRVVTIALDATQRSGGAYDITVLPLMRLYGFYDSGRSTPPTAREVDAVLGRMGSREVRLDDGAGTLALMRAGSGIDLGSIGKGWAVDRAVDAIRAQGVGSALVDLGGNVYGLGTPEDGGAGWTVGVFHPVTGALDHTFVLRDAAVATSGDSEQTHTLGPLTVGHLFDAKHGVPANGHLSASVMAKTGVESDVMSTTAFVLGPDRFRGWPGALETRYIG